MSFTSSQAPRSATETLQVLPPELWYMVKSYLPVSDVASLAFSCKLMKHYFGYTWATMEERDELPFLQYMDKELPEYRLCHKFPMFRLRQDHAIKGPLAITPWTIQQFWPAVQLAMRAHRYGENYGIPLSFFTQEATKADVTTSTEAIIVEDHFLLKTQITSALHESSLARLQETGRQYDINLEGIPHCIHHGTSLNLPSIAREAWFRLSAPKFSKTLSCETCASDWSLDVTQEGEMRVLRVTRWTDCGDGISPLESPEWLRLVSLTRSPRRIGSPMSVRDRYEAYHSAKKIEQNYQAGVASVEQQDRPSYTSPRYDVRRSRLLEQAISRPLEMTDNPCMSPRYDVPRGRSLARTISPPLYMPGNPYTSPRYDAQRSRLLEMTRTAPSSL